MARELSTSDELKARLRAYITRETEEDFFIDGPQLAGDMCICARAQGITLKHLLEMVELSYNSIQTEHSN